MAASSQSLDLTKNDREEDEETKHTPGSDSKTTTELEDELDSLLDSAINDFDKYPSEGASCAQGEALEQEAESENKKHQTSSEIPALPPDQEAFFNAIFSNPEAQQLFSGMGEAFAGLMGDFEQTSQEPQRADTMKQMLQSTFTMMGEDEAGTANLNSPTAGTVPSQPSLPPPRPQSSSPSPPSSRMSEPTTGYGGEDLAQTLGETLHKLAESAKDVKEGEIHQEELMKAFENLNMEGGEEMLLPMVQNMMENLLSKDVLYPSLKEVTDKYPQWLDENKSRLDEANYERYCKQQGIMSSVCQQYEEERDTDSEVIKKERVMKIMTLIQEMESYGEPPKEIVGDMPTTGLQFDANGLPKIPGMPTGEQCRIM